MSRPGADEVEAGTGPKFVIVCWLRGVLCKLTDCTRACKGNTRVGKTRPDLSHGGRRCRCEDLAGEQPLAEGTVTGPGGRSGSAALTWNRCVRFGCERSLSPMAIGGDNAGCGRTAGVGAAWCWVYRNTAGSSKRWQMLPRL